MNQPTARQFRSAAGIDSTLHELAIFSPGNLRVFGKHAQNRFVVLPFRIPNAHNRPVSREWVEVERSSIFDSSGAQWIQVDITGQFPKDRLDSFDKFIPIRVVRKNSLSFDSAEDQAGKRKGASMRD